MSGPALVPPVKTNPNPDSKATLADNGPGIDPEALPKLNGSFAAWAFIVAIPGAIYRCYVWVNATQARRDTVAGVAIIIAMTIMAIGTSRGKDAVPTAVTPVPGLTYKASKDDEHLAMIGKPYGVSRQEMIDANLSLIVTYTNTTCPALNRPATYYAGLLEDGKTHRDGTYCQFTEYKGNNPTYIGMKLAQDSLRKGDDVIVPCTKLSTPLIKKACQSTALAKNVP